MRLPDQYIPDSEKDEKWYLDTINAYLSLQAGNVRLRNERVKDHDNYLIASGVFDSKQFEYVTDAYGMTTPARLVNYPIITSKLDLLVGELIQQPFEYSVEVINSEAISRKNEKRNTVAAEVIMRPLRKQMEQLTGVAFQDDETEEEIPEDVEEYMNMKFRDNVEKMMRVGLDYLIGKYSYKDEFKRGFYDLLICAKAFYKVEVRNGEPRIRRMHPGSLIYDFHANVDTLQDSKFCGDENYLSINEIVEIYRPDKEMMEYLKKIESQNASWYNEFNTQSVINYVYDQNTGLKIRVIEMEWIAQSPMRYKVSPNKYSPDVPYYKMIPDDYKPKKDEKIEVKPINKVYYAVKVGHERLIAYGERPNQVRIEDNYANTSLSYFGVIKHLNGKTISVVDILKNIQTMYNITMYHIEVTMARAGGKYLVYDLAQKPEDMEHADILYHLKNSGIAWINSKQEGGQLNTYNQWTQGDLTMSNTFSQLINLKMMLEDTADKLTGISAARSGITKTNDLVGVTQQNIVQSTTITAPLYDLHYRVIGDVLNKVANTAALCFAPEDRMINVFGDMDFQTFTISKSVSYDQYGIFVKNNSKEARKHQKMDMLLQQAIASGSVPFKEAVKAANADSAVDVERILTKGLEALEAAQIMMKKQEMELQNKSNEIEQHKIDVQLEVANINKEKDITVAQIQAGAKIQQLDKQHIHEQDMAQHDRNTSLDIEMLKGSGADKKADQSQAKPISKDKPKSNNNNKKK
jgi:hypothetical protein